MEGAQTKAVEAVRLAKDDAYFDLDAHRVSELQSLLAESLVPDPLAAPPTQAAPTDLPPVLAIGAPRVVRLADHDDAPVLLATRTTGMRSWSVSEEANARALVTDLRTGTTRWTPLLVSHKRAAPPTPSKSGDPPDAINAASIAVSLTKKLVLRRALGSAWAPGRYALAVVEYDWISNAVVVELDGEPAGAAVQAVPARAPSPFVHPDAAPLPLAGSGAVLVVPREVTQGTPATVRGMVRLPRGRAALAPAATSSPSELLIATLLLFDLDAGDPHAVELAAPAKVVGNDVEAAFTFDLTTAMSERADAGSYQVYLVAGDVIAGPHPMVVRPH